MKATIQVCEYDDDGEMKRHPKLEEKLLYFADRMFMMPHIGEHIGYDDGGAMLFQITDVWYNFVSDELLVITFEVGEPFSLGEKH